MRRSPHPNPRPQARPRRTPAHKTGTRPNRRHRPRRPMPSRPISRPGPEQHQTAATTTPVVAAGVADAAVEAVAATIRPMALRRVRPCRPTLRRKPRHRLPRRARTIFWHARARSTPRLIASHHHRPRAWLLKGMNGRGIAVRSNPRHRPWPCQRPNPSPRPNRRQDRSPPKPRRRPRTSSSPARRPPQRTARCKRCRRQWRRRHRPHPSPPQSDRWKRPHRPQRSPRQRPSRLLPPGRRAVAGGAGHRPESPIARARERARAMLHSDPVPPAPQTDTGLAHIGLRAGK